MNSFLSATFMALGLALFGLAPQDARAETDAAAEEASSGSVAPRDAASGLATGKRQHKPLSAPTGDVDDDGVGGTRAQDHNSSRSNKSSVAAPRDAASGQATGKRSAMGGDDFGESDEVRSGVKSPRDAASGQATGKRQHKPVSPGGAGGGEDGDAAAQDHNSSRSNK